MELEQMHEATEVEDVNSRLSPAPPGDGLFRRGKVPVTLAKHNAHERGLFRFPEGAGRD